MRRYSRCSRHSFSLIELMVVMVILAMLALAVVPNIMSADKQAQVTTTKQNLQALRIAVKNFRAKKNRYPNDLEELTTTTFKDAGVDQYFLDPEQMPVELISDSEGNSTFETIENSEEGFSGDGGWIYVKSKAKVYVDWTEPLDDDWDEFAGQEPSKW